MPRRNMRLYQKAIDLAVQAGDIETATRGIDGINRGWDVDLSKLMARTLIDASHRLRTPAAQSEMAHRMQTAAADAMADGQYDCACELINAAVAWPGRELSPRWPRRFPPRRRKSRASARPIRASNRRWSRSSRSRRIPRPMWWSDDLNASWPGIGKRGCPSWPSEAMRR